jgi:hypothetical protein
VYPTLRFAKDGAPGDIADKLPIFALLRMKELRRRIYGCRGLLGGDHSAQHFCLAEVVLCLLGIVCGGAQGLALQTIRK